MYSLRLSVNCYFFVEMPIAQIKTTQPGVAKAVLPTPLYINRPAAQTLSDATPPIGNIHLFSKIAITLELVMRFWCPLIFRIVKKCLTWSILWLKAPYPTNWPWRRRKDIFTKDQWLNYWMNEWMTKVFVNQPLDLSGSANSITCLVMVFFQNILIASKPKRFKLASKNFDIMWPCNSQ